MIAKIATFILNFLFTKLTEWVAALIKLAREDAKDKKENKENREKLENAETEEDQYDATEDLARKLRGRK